MPRWRQVINPETGKSEFVPLDDAARKRDGHFIHEDFQPFVSPLDGKVISGRRQYEDHCKEHGVVNAAEFSPDFYERKAKERERHYQGNSTRAEKQRRRESINEIINTLERRAENGY